MADVFEGTAIRAISGGTDNHLLLLDIKDTGLNGKEAQELLDTVGITVNKNAIPFDTLPPVKTSGIVSERLLLQLVALMKQLRRK